MNAFERMAASLSLNLPRERAMEGGIRGLSEIELVAVVLGTGFSGVPVHALSTRILDEVGGLPGLAQLGPAALSSVPGLGPAKALRLIASLELGRRTQAAISGRREPLGNSAAVARWCASRIASLDHEELWVLSLDGRNGLRGARRISQGGAHGCAVGPRDVLRAALADAAVSVVIVHNHPSGDPEPSAEDVALTRAVATAGRLIGVPLVDHVVVARAGRYSSLLDIGALREETPAEASARPGEP